MDGEGNKGVELEEGDYKGRCCRPPQDMGCKEQEGLHGDGEGGVLLVVVDHLDVPFTTCFCDSHETGEDATDLHETGEGRVCQSSHQGDVGHWKIRYLMEKKQLN